MSLDIKSQSKIDLRKLQQIVKWIVYSLLIVNFGFYILEDFNRAIHTLDSSNSIFQWTNEFATTIDTMAWFVLLAMFELETYQIDDRQWTAKTEKIIHGIRIVCFLMLAHTLIAFTNSTIEYSKTIPIENIESLCDLTDDGFAYVYNLEYTELDASNCTTLTAETELYQIWEFPLVTTFEGLELERQLVWSDLLEAIVWLIIILAIEVVVRLQNKEITQGRILSVLNAVKLSGYAILCMLAIYWGSLGHWLYVWDTFLWIGGFAVIEMNINEWRDEIDNSAAEAGA